MNKNIQEVLNELGSGYESKVIDYEECVYRDLGDYEIEISGCAYKRQPFHIYVWSKSPVQIVYRKPDIKTIPKLVRELDHVFELKREKENGQPWPEEV